MSFDVTNFSDYVTREAGAITKALFSGGDTGNFARYMVGIKGTTEVPVLSGGVTLQKGNCVDPQGSVALDTVELKVCPWTFYEEFCMDDIQEKFPKMVLKAGSSNSDFPKGWEAMIIDLKLKGVQELLERTYWQGDEGSSDTSINLFDGFIKGIDASGDAIDGNVDGEIEITKANVKGIIAGMRDVAPTIVKRSPDFTYVVGDDTFDKYIQKEKDDNLYHYKPEHDNGIYNIGGSQGTLMRVYGLDGTQRIFAGLGTDFIVGMDVEGEEMKIKVWYDEDSDKVKMRAKAKSGVTNSNINEIVQFTLDV